MTSLQFYNTEKINPEERKFMLDSVFSRISLCSTFWSFYPYHMSFDQDTLFKHCIYVMRKKKVFLLGKAVPSVTCDWSVVLIDWLVFNANQSINQHNREI